MNIEQELRQREKRTIALEEMLPLMRVDPSDTRGIFDSVNDLMENRVIEPIKNSGKTGNLQFPLFKRYRILVKKEFEKETIDSINTLHPMLLRSGYLSSNPSVFQKYRPLLDALSRFFFEGKANDFISRKERSFALFGQEKILDDGGVKSLLKRLQISKADLRFYDTPEYCFHDFIPQRKDKMTLLLCENKDIWFNIRRCMFEDHYKSLFGTRLNGVVYGEGNKVSDKNGALIEYVRFMGNPDVEFLYWGDIDREGFDIFRRTKEVNEPLQMSLFIPGYKKMIERAKDIVLEDSPSSKKQKMNFSDLLSDFAVEERLFILEVLGHNKLIPQEIIPYTILTEE